MDRNKVFDPTKSTGSMKSLVFRLNRPIAAIGTCARAPDCPADTMHFHSLQ